MPLLYTKRLTTPVYSRGGACPRPGTAPTTPKVRAYGDHPKVFVREEDCVQPSRTQSSHKKDQRLRRCVRDIASTV
jgi:hypothetical protein